MKKPSLYSDVECKTRVYHDLITIIKTNSDGQKKINKFFAVHKGSNLRDKAKEVRNLANTVFAKLCLFKALSLSYRSSFFTPKLVEVNLCEADVAELAVV